MAMKENSKAILTYLQENDGQDLTANDVAAALDLSAKSVNGSFTAFQKKDLGYREEAEVEMPDKSHKKVKYLRLTEKGKNFDPDAADESK